MGSFFSYGELRLGQGRENSKAYLRENPTLTAEIETKIREAAGLVPRPSAVSDAGPVPEPNEGADVKEKEEELVE